MDFVKRPRKEIYCPWRINADQILENGRLITVDYLLRSNEYKFLVFCFGEYYSMKNTEQMMDEWNNWRKDKLLLHLDDDMETSLKKMKEFYVPKFNKTQIFKLF